MGIFSKINFGLTKTRNKMAGAIDDLFGDADGSYDQDQYGGEQDDEGAVGGGVEDFDDDDIGKLINSAAMSI